MIKSRLCITNKDFPLLTKTIKLDLLYLEDGFWLAYNPKYMLRASAESINELKERIIEQLEYHVFTYIIHKGKTPRQTEKYKKAIYYLSKLIIKKV